MAVTNYLSTKLLDHVLGNGVYTPPAQLFVGLHVANPTPAGDTSSEVTGGSYSRQESSFNPASPDADLAIALVFTALPAATITYAGLWDALAGGNLLFYGAFATPRVIEENGGLDIAVGEIVWGLD